MVPLTAAATFAAEALIEQKPIMVANDVTASFIGAARLRATRAASNTFEIHVSRLCVVSLMPVVETNASRAR